MSEGSEAKKHAASDAKLRKQREKGSVASSAESSGFLACALGIALILGTAPLIWIQLQFMITSSMEVIAMPFDQARSVSSNVLGRTLLLAILPILGITLVTAFVAAMIYNKGFIFAMKPVIPQLNRVSPKAGFKRIYGRRGLIETPVSATRILLWLAFAGLLGFWPFLALLQQWTCTGECMAIQIMPIFRLLVIGAVVIFILAAVVDMIVQNKVFLSEQRMTETEQKRERKDQHGTPEIRQERRRLMREANTPRREAKAENATMCFFFEGKAVGIEFRPPDVVAPYVVVKALTAREALKLRQDITNQGWPEKEHELLTKAGLTRPLGDPLDEGSYAAFISAVQDMFGM
ncbi:EscU/YscU/HrcU family type III secretion system export apparatus switch protein [Yoonia sp. 2307UL14-13]|uniref:EscU/YscU/HrcU family type III secretion system export apparatus switch protein n=1 Tax=Yoonia sp. 2307UL14-13 TaxID=3126506 RepID=UPI0030A04DBE